MMARPTERLREEHDEIRPHIEDLKALGHDVPTASVDALREGLEDAYLFLENTLLPHARAEDEVLYPAVAALLGSDKATQAMTHDHDAIARLAGEIGVLRVELVDEGEVAPQVQREIQRVLYGLHTLAMLHLAKEEDLYFTLMDAHMDEARVGQIITDMERVAHEARRRVA